MWFTRHAQADQSTWSTCQETHFVMANQRTKSIKKNHNKHIQPAKIKTSLYSLMVSSQPLLTSLVSLWTHKFSMHLAIALVSPHHSAGWSEHLLDAHAINAGFSIPWATWWQTWSIGTACACNILIKFRALLIHLPSILFNCNIV